MEPRVTVDVVHYVERIFFHVSRPISQHVAGPHLTAVLVIG